jgi:hypothetical protein
MARLGVAVHDEAGSDVILDDLGNLQALAVDRADLPGPDPNVDRLYRLGSTRRGEPCVGRLRLGSYLASKETRLVSAPQIGMTRLTHPHLSRVPDLRVQINAYSLTRVEFQRVFR